MKLENNIGWCDETVNVVTGCCEVSRGCRNCYAKTGTPARVLRHGGFETWGPKGVRVPVQGFEDKVRKLNRYRICDRCHETHGVGTKRNCDVQHGSAVCNGRLRPIRLFADSNSDWLDEKWRAEDVLRLLAAVHGAPNVDFQLLTKRPQRFEEQVERAMSAVDPQPAKDALFDANLHDFITDWVEGLAPRNVWLGFSAEGQREFEERRRHLLPAAVNFVSCEPLLEPIGLQFGEDIDSDVLDWVIVGGESGKSRRDPGPKAIESVVAQCVEAGVTVYCKQDTYFIPGQQGRLSHAAWRRKEFPR